LDKLHFTRAVLAPTDRKQSKLADDSSQRWLASEIINVHFSISYSDNVFDEFGKLWNQYFDC